MGTATAVGSFADVGHSRSLEHLRTRLAARLIHYGFEDLDAATIRMSAPRRFTQEISRHVYECSHPDGERAYAGIRYASRLGDEVYNWAICEPADLVNTSPARRRLARVHPGPSASHFRAECSSRTERAMLASSGERMPP